MTRIFAGAVIMIALLAFPAGGPVGWCAGLAQPVDGPILEGFAPTGRFSGHWGVDWGVPEGTEVRAAGPGVVTFAGTVVANQTVTVDHGGGLRTSYSYLSSVIVRRGDHVTDVTTIGMSGGGHGTSALHFSVRVGDAYLDPLPIVGCRLAAPSAALRLVPVRELN